LIGIPIFFTHGAAFTASVDQRKDIFQAPKPKRKYGASEWP
jgi:hypothetical protein